MRIFSFKEDDTHLSEVTITAESNLVGKAIGELTIPDDVAVVALVRKSVARAPKIDERLELGDKLFFLNPEHAETDLEEQFAQEDSIPAGIQALSGNTENSGL